MIRGVSMNTLGTLLRSAIRSWPKQAVKPLILRDGRQAGWRVSARSLGCLEIVLPRTEVPREARNGENKHRAFDIVVDPHITLEEDAKRRDFTFNALYLDLQASIDEARVIRDPIGRGLYDLEHKFVSTTHETSFRDDPLRTLRALRFVSTLGYDLTIETYEQMQWFAENVTGLSAKGYASGTVLNELSRLLMGSGAVRALRLARDTGVLVTVLPELAPMIGFDQRSRWHDLSTDEHTFKALETAVHVDAPLRVRWALLFHDSGKPESAWIGKDGRQHYYEPSDKVWAEVSGPRSVKPQDHEVVGERIWRAAASRLGAEKSLRDEVSTLIRHHMVNVSSKNPATRVRRMRVQFGDAMLRDLLLHRACDYTGKANSATSALSAIADMELIREEAQAAGVPCSVRDLEIDGHDIKALGLEGREIGRVMAAVLDEAVCQPDELRLSRDWQLERAEKV